MPIDPLLLDQAKELAVTRGRTLPEDIFLEIALNRYVAGHTPTTAPIAQVVIASRTPEVKCEHPYSQPLRTVALSPDVQRYIVMRGIRYVGEVYLVAVIRTVNADTRGELLDVLKIPRDSQPLKEGWRPPYWDDQNLLAALSMEPDAYSRGKFLGLYKHYSESEPKSVAETLVRLRKSRPGQTGNCNGLTSYEPQKLEWAQTHLR